LNPTVAAGVAYGSGGTQIRKGPAYTERALWCEIDEKGKVAIRNTLGIKAANDDELFKKIESGSIAADDIDPKFAHVPASSSSSYSKHVCVLDGNVSRFNADTSGIEPCRSEGKVLILATLHDTFPEPRYTKTLWVSCNSLEEAQQLKREVLLNNPADLPVACEYMDRDSFDVVDSAGRFLCHALSKFGIGSSLEKMWNLKLKVESLPLPKFDVLPDKILYHFNNVLPKALPDKVYSLGKLYNHHLIVTLGEYGDGNMERTEKRLQEFCDKHGSVYVHECEKPEVSQITFFRFAAAPAFKTYCQGTNTQGLSIDYALAKNNFSKPEFRHLQGSDVPIKRMRYSHFGCNVVHEDICFPNSTDVEEVKMKIKAEIESEGGKLPAEHGHGTEYKAPQATQERWQRMDKLNIMNPGVGGTSYFEKYRKEEIL
jgi:D-lactate dehydrogenase